MEYLIISILVILIFIAGCLVYVAAMLFRIASMVLNFTEEVVKYSEDIKQLKMPEFVEHQKSINSKVAETVLQLTKILQQL